MPEIRVASIHQYIAHDFDAIISGLRIRDPELAGRFVLDDRNPDFIIASDSSLTHIEDFIRLRHYLSSRKEAVFILLCFECIDPDLNVFDYAAVWNRDLQCGDRIVQNLPYIWSRNNDDTFKNDITREEAIAILESGPKFCSFVYSHSSERRDAFFRLLSQYKHVDSSGAWLNNTGTKSTRYTADWYNGSISMKSGYKFSIAMENATYRGYTTEKLISSLQAHTVPIYWGDPAVTDYINPKAFINCHDYPSFEAAIERVKEVDSNDDLWLDMVTQPWQTEEQYARTLQAVADYERFTHNIFSQDVHAARRRPDGYWGDYCRKSFTAFVGAMPPVHVRVFMKMKLKLAVMMPERLRIVIKKILHMD